MSVSKAQQRATNKYVSKVYDRINIFVPKGRRENIQAHAKGRGESTNSFVNRAITEAMERDTGEVTHPVRSQPSESGDAYLTAELLEAAREAVKLHGGELSCLIKDAITSYLKSYPSIMQIKNREKELYAAQQSARKRVGIEEPEESEKKEDSFSDLSTDEIIEKFQQVGRIRNLSSQNDDLQDGEKSTENV